MARKKAELILTKEEDRPKKREKKGKTPYKCPVCEGKGVLRCGFYEVSPTGMLSEALAEECKTCKGAGIIWG